MKRNNSAIEARMDLTLSGQITIKDGASEQSNFDGYQVLRIRDAPEVEVHILPGEMPRNWLGRRLHFDPASRVTRVFLLSHPFARLRDCPSKSFIQQTLSRLLADHRRSSLTLAFNGAP